MKTKARPAIYFVEANGEPARVTKRLCVNGGDIIYHEGGSTA